MVDDGSQPLAPSVMKNKPPPGTTLVSGTWSAAYYAPDGTYICTAPGSCNSFLLTEAENGGYIIVNMFVTGATVGETLSMTYTFGSGSSAVTNTITFTVTSG